VARERLGLPRGIGAGDDDPVEERRELPHVDGLDVVGLDVLEGADDDLLLGERGKRSSSSLRGVEAVGADVLHHGIGVRYRMDAPSAARFRMAVDEMAMGVIEYVMILPEGADSNSRGLSVMRGQTSGKAPGPLRATARRRRGSPPRSAPAEELSQRCHV
jgi:hypothetical protein